MPLEEKMNELAKMKMEEGFEEGKKAGLEEGIREGVLTVDKTLKEEETDIQQLIKVTGLTKEEIENL